MYIEISPRRTGKTTRLIEDVVVKASNGAQCIIITLNYSMRDIIRDMIDEVKEYKWMVEPKIYTDSFMCGVDWQKVFSPDSYVYFDEFDFMKMEISVLKNGYYCTTASKKRTYNDIKEFYDGKRHDNLLNLLKCNNGQHTSYMSSIEVIQRVHAIKTIHDKERFDVEINNHWMEL